MKKLEREVPVFHSHIHMTFFAMLPDCFPERDQVLGNRYYIDISDNNDTLMGLS